MVSDGSTFVRRPHAPAHLFLPGSTYMVTASTYDRRPLFDAPAKRDLLVGMLFVEVDRLGWRLEAWAVMPNHYHWVGVAPAERPRLARLVAAVHTRSAIAANRADATPGRRVWYQYWDTCLTYERSYLARLNYVHNNPRKHGLVERAEDYPWCSMAGFLDGGDDAFRRTVLACPTDRVQVVDDF